MANPHENLCLLRKDLLQNCFVFVAVGHAFWGIYRFMKKTRQNGCCRKYYNPLYLVFYMAHPHETLSILRKDLFNLFFKFLALGNASLWIYRSWNKNGKMAVVGKPTMCYIFFGRRLDKTRFWFHSRKVRLNNFS